MGADYLMLFDWEQCKRICGMSEEELEEFLERRGGSLAFYTDSVRWTMVDVMAQVVDDYCFGEKMLVIDYPGCFVEAFHSEYPPNSIRTVELFQDEAEEVYFLMDASAADKMLAELLAHRDELRVMTEESLRMLAEWRDLCASDPSVRLAYVFD